VWIAALVSIALPPVCHGQATALAKGILTNHDVVTLANAGFSEGFILEMIATSPTKFDLTADAMADLAKNGITEDIIRAMRNRGLKLQLPGEHQQTANSKATRVFVETGSHSQSQAAEVTKTFERNCPGFSITNRQEEAAFVVVLERGRPKWFRSQSKMTVFDQSGDTILNTSTHDLSDAVRGFCAAGITRQVSAAR